VVIAIIGVLIALLLPAVQAAREAARRMQCTNNQKQIVLGMHNYHDTQQSFPWGAHHWGNGTWAIQVLPFIEKNQIASEYNWDVRYCDGTNSQLLSDLVISTYTCPSDGNNNKPIEYAFRGHNYVVCMGREGVLNLVYKRYPSDGNPRNCLIGEMAFGKESLYRAMFTGSCWEKTGSGDDDKRLVTPLTTTFEDITDGTSNTVALSETVQGLSPDGDMNDLRGHIWYGMTCFFNTNLPPNTREADITDWYHLTAYNVRHPLTLMSYSTSDADGNYLRFSARSWHVGGVNAGLADGSIRFVQDQINLEIWRAVGSTNGGEIESLH
jgi:type II secretory pathway pseudopilin PulG